MSVEHIMWNGKSLACVIGADSDPSETSFLTPSELNLQVGFVVYGAGGEVARHVHLPLERQITGTSEVLLVRKGRCLLDVYSDSCDLVGTREVKTGDIVALFGGGHGFRILEDTVFVEIKQGPYTGLQEKDRF